MKSQIKIGAVFAEKSFKDRTQKVLKKYFHSFTCLDPAMLKIGLLNDGSLNDDVLKDYKNAVLNFTSEEFFFLNRVADWDIEILNDKISSVNSYDCFYWTEDIHLLLDLIKTETPIYNDMRGIIDFVFKHCKREENFLEEVFSGNPSADIKISNTTKLVGELWDSYDKSNSVV